MRAWGRAFGATTTRALTVLFRCAIRPGRPTVGIVKHETILVVGVAVALGAEPFFENPER